MPYTYTQSGFNLAKIATGEILWYSVPGKDRQEALKNAGDWAIRKGFDVGETRLEDYSREVEHPAYMQVLLGAMDEARERGDYEEGDDTLLGLSVNEMLNMARDAGRPSDAARSIARSYLSDTARFRREFAEARKHRANYYPEDGR